MHKILARKQSTIEPLTKMDVQILSSIKKRWNIRQTMNQKQSLYSYTKQVPKVEQQLRALIGHQTLTKLKSNQALGAEI